jgi:hypothetical protein
MTKIIISKVEVRESFKKCVKRSVATDIVFFWIRHQGCWGVMNKAEMTQQMKMWRKMALNGEIAMIRHNNQDDITFEGMKMWSLCLQSYKNGEIEEDQNTIDAHGGFIFCKEEGGFRAVSGHIYGFKSKANRDAVFEYIMKGIELKKYGVEVPAKPRILMINEIASPTKEDDNEEVIVFKGWGNDTYEKMSDVE